MQGKHLILVSAISPTPAGEGKTTISIGLTEGLNRIGKKTTVVLREPSLGPVFGIKGGATGGGYSQVLPMEDINLHFTGDFNAIEKAHNLLAALIDNNIQSKTSSLGLDPRTVTWKRVMDMNDRSLRHIIVGLGGTSSGIPRETGFDITAASEIMAILCLSESFMDLKERLGNIFIGYTYDKRPLYARDLKAHGAMAALLKTRSNPIWCRPSKEIPPSFMEVRLPILLRERIPYWQRRWDFRFQILSSRRLVSVLTWVQKNSSISSVSKPV